MAIVSLLTDFGTRDHFVGVMKGVILSYAPDVAIVDITHDISPQNVYEASLQLALAWSYFPAGTVHCAVVDPGVGTQRKIIAVAVDDQWFVGPDNGIFSHVIRQGSIRAYSFEPALFETRGATFHGRDIFAPLAVRLAMNPGFVEHGTPEDGIEKLRLLAVERRDGRVHAHVEWVDHYGNLVTNVEREYLNGATPVAFTIEAGTFAAFRSSYAEARADEVFALWNAHGRLEIAVNGDSAADRLHAGFGDAVRIELGD